MDWRKSKGRDVSHLERKISQTNIFLFIAFVYITCEQVWAAKTKYKSSGEIDFFAKTFKNDKNPETDDQKIGVLTNLSAAFKKGKIRGKVTLNGKVGGSQSRRKFSFYRRLLLTL